VVVQSDNATESYLVLILAEVFDVVVAACAGHARRRRRC
jgi:hypothetical protein